MSKQDFLNSLKVKLSDLPKDDVNERLNFYSEMIDDMIEEGLYEEEAVKSIGSVDDIASQIISDTSNVKNDVKRDVNNDAKTDNKKTKRRLKGWEIALLILGSPLWIPLLIAAVSIIISLYAVLWSVIVALWSVFATLVGSFVGGVVSGMIFICIGKALSGAAIIALAIACAGISIFAFFGCLYATKGAVYLRKKTFIGIKNIFCDKEGVL